VTGDKATVIANSFKAAGVEGVRPQHSFHTLWNLAAKCDTDLGPNDTCTLTKQDGSSLVVTGDKATAIANSFREAGVEGERRPHSFHLYWNLTAKCDIDLGPNDTCTLSKEATGGTQPSQIITLEPEVATTVSNLMSQAGVPDSAEPLSITTFIADIRCTESMAPGNPAECLLRSPASEEPIEIDDARATAMVRALDQAGARINNGANAVTSYRAKEMTCTTQDSFPAQAECSFKKAE
jgi:hypothetical protein